MSRVHESWGSGPWDDEPDRLEFGAHGLKCKIVRHHRGHLCGYVEDRYGVSDHGLPEDITGGGRGWLGFDCNHIWDNNPSDMAESPSTKEHRGPYRTFNEVKERTETLALAVRLRGRWWRRVFRWVGRHLMCWAQEPTRWAR